MSKGEAGSALFSNRFPSVESRKLLVVPSLGIQFNNGWNMIILEHMAAHSQSAAEQFVLNRLETEHNSLGGKELNW